MNGSYAFNSIQSSKKNHMAILLLLFKTTPVPMADGRGDIYRHGLDKIEQSEK